MASSALRTNRATTQRPRTITPAAQPAASSTARSRLALRTPRARTAAPEPPPSPPVLPTRTNSPDIPTFGPYTLPATIWDENSHYDSWSTAEYSPAGFTRDVLEAATRGQGHLPPLRVRGWDADAAADTLTRELDYCGSMGDYTGVLVPDRAFGL